MWTLQQFIQADQCPKPKAAGHSALFFFHQMNRVNNTMTAPSTLSRLLLLSLLLQTLPYSFQHFTHTVMVAVWINGDNIGCINEVTPRRAGLILRWETIHRYTTFLFNQATHGYIVLNSHLSYENLNRHVMLRIWERGRNRLHFLRCCARILAK